MHAPRSRRTARQQRKTLNTARGLMLGVSGSALYAWAFLHLVRNVQAAVSDIPGPRGSERGSCYEALGEWTWAAPDQRRQAWAPRCDRFGDYEPVQCDETKADIECWCVDRLGSEIPGFRHPFRPSCPPQPLSSICGLPVSKGSEFATTDPRPAECLHRDGGAHTAWETVLQACQVPADLLESGGSGVALDSCHSSLCGQPAECLDAVAGWAVALHACNPGSNYMAALAVADSWTAVCSGASSTSQLLNDLAAKATGGSGGGGKTSPPAGRAPVPPPAEHRPAEDADHSSSSWLKVLCVVALLVLAGIFCDASLVVSFLFSKRSPPTVTKSGTPGKPERRSRKPSKGPEFVDNQLSWARGSEVPPATPESESWVDRVVEGFTVPQQDPAEFT